MTLMRSGMPPPPRTGGPPVTNNRSRQRGMKKPPPKVEFGDSPFRNAAVIHSPIASQT
jgi:hypothetical protein